MKKEPELNTPLLLVISLSSLATFVCSLILVQIYSWGVVGDIFASGSASSASSSASSSSASSALLVSSPRLLVTLSELDIKRIAVGAFHNLAVDGKIASGSVDVRRREK